MLRCHWSTLKDGARGGRGGYQTGVLGCGKGSQTGWRRGEGPSGKFSELRVEGVGPMFRGDGEAEEGPRKVDGESVGNGTRLSYGRWMVNLWVTGRG